MKHDYTIMKKIMSHIVNKKYIDQTQAVSARLKYKKVSEYNLENTQHQMYFIILFLAKLSEDINVDLVLEDETSTKLLIKLSSKYHYCLFRMEHKYDKTYLYNLKRELIGLTNLLRDYGFDSKLKFVYTRSVALL